MTRPRRSSCRLALALVLALPGVAAAQYRAALAVGPAIPLGAGPALGWYLRGEAFFKPAPRRWNILLDVYYTNRPAGVERTPVPDPKFPVTDTLVQSTSERQFGLDLTGVFTLSPAKRWSPYLLLGVVVRNSNGVNVVTTVNDTGAVISGPTSDAIEGTQVDVVGGVGTWLPIGQRRRWRLEARLYGGVGNLYLPVTASFAF
ncbi:MAG: hypothetical protein ACHQ2E_03915 [Gemmatimonadales bacterium]